MGMKHSVFEHNIRLQLEQIFQVIRELMEAPAPVQKRSIGFVTPDDTPKRPSSNKS